MITLGRIRGRMPKTSESFTVFLYCGKPLSSDCDVIFLVSLQVKFEIEW